MSEVKQIVGETAVETWIRSGGAILCERPCALRLYIIRALLLLIGTAKVDTRCTTDIVWRFVSSKAAGAAKNANSCAKANATTLPVFAVAICFAFTV